MNSPRYLQLRPFPTPSPFAAGAGKRVKDKVAYCQRQINIFAKWFAETGNKKFTREAAKWQSKIKLIQEDKL